MATLRQRIFIYTSVFIGVLLSVVLLIIYARRDTAPEVVNEQTPVTDSAAVQNGEAVLPPRTVPVIPSTTTGVGSASQVPSDERYAMQAATVFVERFGTYSSHSENKNIDDILPLATEQMQNWLESQRTEYASLYESMTTRVVSADIISFTARDRATVSLGAQRIHEVAGEERASYQTARVELEYRNTDWLVSGVYWEVEE